MDDSSDPSTQSLIPLHIFIARMHSVDDEPPRCDRMHMNSFGAQLSTFRPQFLSSEPSWQSRMPLHFLARSTHAPYTHLNVVSGHTVCEHRAGSSSDPSWQSVWPLHTSSMLSSRSPDWHMNVGVWAARAAPNTINNKHRETGNHFSMILNAITTRTELAMQQKCHRSKHK